MRRWVKWGGSCVLLAGGDTARGGGGGGGLAAAVAVAAGTGGAGSGRGAVGTAVEGGDVVVAAWTGERGSGGGRRGAASLCLVVGGAARKNMTKEQKYWCWQHLALDCMYRREKVTRAPHRHHTKPIRDKPRGTHPTTPAACAEAAGHEPPRQHATPNTRSPPLFPNPPPPAPPTLRPGRWDPTASPLKSGDPPRSRLARRPQH